MVTNNAWNSEDPAQVAKGGSGATTLTGILTGNGTSAFTANAVTENGVLIGGASNAASSLAVASDNTVLVGNTAAAPSFTGTPTVTSIDFTASSTALDFYEEGSWSPGVEFGGGSTGITYTTQQGRYTRIGNVVFVTILLTLSNKGSSTGAATITNFPFTPNGFVAQNTCRFTSVQNYTFSGSNTSLALETSGVTGTSLFVLEVGTTGQASSLNTAWANNTRLEGNFTYHVA